MNAAGFEALVREHGLLVRRVLTRMLGASAAVEDLEQEVWLGVWKNLPRFRGESSITTFLYRCARNKAIDLMRKKRSTVHGELPEDLASPNPGPGEMVNRQDDLALFHAALRVLSFKDRTLIVLREWEGLSYQDLKAITGAAEGTLKARLFRARQKLERALEKLGYEP